MDVNCLETLVKPVEEMIDKRSHLCNEPTIKESLSDHPNDSSVEDINDRVIFTSEPNDNEGNIERTNSSRNIFVEIPVDSKSSEYNSPSDSEDSVIFSNDGEDGFSVNAKPVQNEKKPKDLLVEISEILLSLSDDERFIECINFSNNNGFVFENGVERKRTSVDMIFTYNVLNILFSKLKELKSYYEIIQADSDK